MIIMILWMLGWMILVPCCAIYGIVKGITSKNQQTTYVFPKKKNPIDKHGDDIYGTIDWLREGKL